MSAQHSSAGLLSGRDIISKLIITPINTWSGGRWTSSVPESEEFKNKSDLAELDTGSV